jgi:hypothetical protein
MRIYEEINQQETRNEFSDRGLSQKSSRSL